MGSSDLDIPSWIYDDAYDMNDYNILDGNFVAECARSMNKLKISAEAQVVAEHLMEFDILHYNMIAYTFRRIICNKEKTTQPWDLVWCTCIEKCKLLTYIQQYRPITIISAIQKLFLSSVMKLSEAFLQPLNKAQHAFRKGYSTQEILHIIRSLIEKAKEWQEHIYVGDGDVEKAYDNTEHAHIINALIADGCPKESVASMAGGWRSRVKFKIRGLYYR